MLHPRPKIDPSRVRPHRLSDTAAALSLIGLALALACALPALAIQNSINAQLGFDYSTPQIRWNYEPFLIARVDRGGIMARSGMLVDDRVMFDDVSTLYALLISRQGARARIPIERRGTPLEIVVRVPPMRLPFSPRLRRLIYGSYWDGFARAPGAGRIACPDSC